MEKKVLGSVASGHPLTTQAAAETLQQGGNAFDAIVSAAFMSTMAEPLLNSLGGGGFLLAKTARNEEVLFDFFVNFPGMGNEKIQSPNMTEITVDFTNSSQVFHTGPGSIATPGALKGLIETQQKLGALKLKQVLEPSIKAAKQGVEVNKTQAYVASLLAPILQISPQAVEYFYPRHELIKEGSLYKNSKYADYLSSLHEDCGEDFYKGELGRKLCQDLGPQTLLNDVDLNKYQVLPRKPLKSRYRNYSLITNPLPSLGGTLILTLLKNLEEYDLSDLKWGSKEHLVFLAEAMIKLERDKNSGHFKNPKTLNTFTKGTTHISIADSLGNLASMSLSNGEGSGYYMPGTGIMLNNMLGEDDLFDKNNQDFTPGERVLSMMSPCILESDEHKIVIGSGGSKRIRSSLLQVISNLIDFNQTLEEAIHQARINWDGEQLQMEPGYPEDSPKEITKNLPVNIWSHKEFYFGGAHAVLDTNEAVGDQRRGGAGQIVYSQ